MPTHRRTSAVCMGSGAAAVSLPPLTESLLWLPVLLLLLLLLLPLLLLLMLPLPLLLLLLLMLLSLLLLLLLLFKASLVPMLLRLLLVVVVMLPLLLLLVPPTLLLLSFALPCDLAFVADVDAPLLLLLQSVNSSITRPPTDTRMAVDWTTVKNL